MVRPSSRLSGLWQLASKFHWVVFDNEGGWGSSAVLPKGEQEGWQPIPSH